MLKKEYSVGSIQTEGTEIWVSGRQDTRITGWGDTRPDNGKDWAYDAELRQLLQTLQLGDVKEGILRGLVHIGLGVASGLSFLGLLGLEESAQQALSILAQHVNVLIQQLPGTTLSCTPIPTRSPD